MSLSGPAVPNVQDPNSVASTAQSFNTQTANQQQGINTANAGAQQGINTATAGAQQDINAQTAAQQQGYNFLDSAAQQQASMVGQSNPFGSLSYSQTGTGAGGIPLYSSNVNLNPQLQGVLNSLMGQSNTLLSNANYGSQNPADVIGGMTSGTTQDLLNKETSYLKPYFDTQTSQLDTQLRNQGFAPGQPGYDNAMRAVQNNQGNTVTGFLAQAEPAAYQQSVSSYAMPLTLAAQEMGLIQPDFFNRSLVNTPQSQLSAPTVSGTQLAGTQLGGTTVAPTDYASMVSNYNNANMAAYNAKVAANGNMMSGLFGIPSAVLGGWAKGGFPGLSSLGGAAGGAGAAGGDAAAMAGMGSADATASLLASLGPMAMV